MNLSVLSTEYVEVPITAPDNPTADTVQMAFILNGASPGSGDWKSAIWTTVNGVYYACCLVGPGSGGVVLAVGSYKVWVKITDNPEVPVRAPGNLTVY